MNCIEELNKYGLTKDTYDQLLKTIDSKLDGDLDIDWAEIVQKYNLSIHPDTVRKASTSIFGGKFRSEYLKNTANVENITSNLDDKLAEIRKERIKLQTANVERNRIDRHEARVEMFYEYIGSVCNTLPLPDFKPLIPMQDTKAEYLLTISDIHYGAVFESVTNWYSPDVTKERFNILLGETIEFIKKHEVQTLHVLETGDSIQGILRINDLKINDSSIVKATVEISKLIAQFLNKLSEYCKVVYYHVPFANHTQLRNLGTKASELADEDLEYIIGHYIQDLCIMNDRITVNLAEEGSQYIDFTLVGNKIISGHGHTFKNYKNSLRDLSILNGVFYDYCIMGHYHGGDITTSHEGVTNDCEIIVAPSFIGSDPYSDSLMKGSKASCLILGFSEYGHTETYKIILN